jgi:hypothetical protein
VKRRVELRENWVGLEGFKTLTQELGGEREWQQGVVVVDIVAAPDWSEPGGPEGSDYASDIQIEILSPRYVL